LATQHNWKEYPGFNGLGSSNSTFATLDIATKRPHWKKKKKEKVPR
jgi:hypothetical protein